MATKDNNPAQMELDEEEKKYLVQSPIEILSVLRTIMQRNALVTLHFDSGDDSILTSILDIDSERGELVMDSGDNQKLNQQAIAEKSLICTTAHDEVKIKFVCDGIRKTRFNQKEALGAKLPDALLRLQRRENFRVATPLAKPLKCVIKLPAGQGPATAELILLDISCGGMAVIDHHPRISLEPGDAYSDCRIDLPDIGAVTFRMRVKESFPYTLKNGLTCMRAGCEFVSMPQNMLILVQRYITRLQQEKNARLTGLG